MDRTCPRDRLRKDAGRLSWKDAADSHDSVASDALVIPHELRTTEAGVPPDCSTSRLRRWKFAASTRSPVMNSGLPDSMMVIRLSI